MEGILNDVFANHEQGIHHHLNNNLPASGSKRTVTK
jgi:hypothetical protein